MSPQLPMWILWTHTFICLGEMPRSRIVGLMNVYFLKRVKIILSSCFTTLQWLYCKIYKLYHSTSQERPSFPDSQLALVPSASLCPPASLLLSSLVLNEPWTKCTPHLLTPLLLSQSRSWSFQIIVQTYSFSCVSLHAASADNIKE